MVDKPDPAAQSLLKMMEDRNTPPTYRLSPKAARQRLEEMAEMIEPRDVGDIEEFSIEGPAGTIPLRVYVPEGEGPFPTLVYFHGGGWTIGGLDTHENICTDLCARAQAVVVSVDYRLAPEHPFPAAVEDAYAAVEWLSESAGDISGDPDRLAVGGDSAGGNLAAAVSLMARDRGGPEIAHQLLVYPVVSSPLVHDFDSYEENAEGYYLERASMEWYFDNYCPNDIHARNPYFAPLLADDFSELPPATIITAGFDPLRDEGAAYARSLEDAGVDVRYECYEEMIHLFVSLPDMLSQGDEALDILADELNKSVST